MNANFENRPLRQNGSGGHDSEHENLNLVEVKAAEQSGNVIRPKAFNPSIEVEEPEVHAVVLNSQGGDLVQTPQDRGRIKAIKAISALEQQEKRQRESVIEKTGFFDRVKGWFREKNETTAQDDRTLDEIMAERDPAAAARLEAARKTAEAAAAPVRSEADLVKTSQDRARIKAIKTISALEQQEKRERGQSAKTPGFFSRVKSWFGNRKTEFSDDRTLKERMAEIEATKILEVVRRKLVMNPASLTRQDVAMLSADDMKIYEDWRDQQIAKQNAK